MNHKHGRFVRVELRIITPMPSPRSTFRAVRSGKGLGPVLLARGLSSMSIIDCRVFPTALCRRANYFSGAVLYPRLEASTYSISQDCLIET